MSFNTVSITCSLASLGNGSSQQSAVIDNSTDLYADALVMVKAKTTSTVSATGTVEVWAYASVDGGTTYTDTATGSDAAITPTSPSNLKFVGRFNAVANTTTYKGGPFSVAAAFGGYGLLPPKWGLVIKNSTGAALDGTGGNHGITCVGIK